MPMDDDSDDEDTRDTQASDLLTKVVSKGSTDENPLIDKGTFVGHITCRKDIISGFVRGGRSKTVARKTSLVTIDLKHCGNPPYQAGDHVKVYPRNIVSIEDLQLFASHLAGNLNIDDNMYATLDNEDISSSELAVSMPLLDSILGQVIPLKYLLRKKAALLAPVSMQTFGELAHLATDTKDKSVLSALGQDKTEYERMNSLTGLKWIDLFRTFPSLSGKVPLKFLLCNIKPNHPRSYSIASCKEIVGSELHLCVGRYVFSRGGSNMEAGVCSNFLTSTEPGDEVLFTLESAPSFHHPLDPSCPIVFICTGTGKLNFLE